MPRYSYQCEKGHQHEKICSIEEMLAYEEKGCEPCRQAQCKGRLVRVYGQAPSTQSFKAGWYENVADDPVYIGSMQELYDITKKNGLRSAYASDMGGMFGLRRNRWI